MVKRLLLVTALVGLLAAAPAHAQPYTPDDDESVTVTDTTLVPGESFTMTAGGFAGGAEVTATFFSEPVVIARGTADAAGTVTLTGRVPEDASPGIHTIVVSGEGADGGLLELRLTVEVLGDGACPDPCSDADLRTDGSLPRTGRSSTMPLTGVAAVLLSLGGVIVLAARRRSARAAVTTED